MYKIRFIVNPISGVNRNPEKIVRWIENTFESSPHQFEVVYTRAAGDATVLARQAVEQKMDIVVAVGGDGTINEIGRSLLDSRIALGIVPAGSGNGFARNFNIPLDQRKAIELLLNPRLKKIDAGKINNQYFFNVAGLGLDAMISQNFEQFGMRGPIPYFLVGAKSYFKYQPNPVKIILDDRKLDFSPMLLSIANAPQYGNGAIIAPRAVPDDGLLDFCILDSIPVWKAAPRLYRLFNGTIDQVDGFHCFRAGKAIIKRATADAIHTDGNPVTEEADLEVEVLPGALKIVVGE